jgi:hypothetical protein
MNIKTLLLESGINLDNTIVIGSGILNTLELRKNNNVKIIVSEQIYTVLLTNKSFQQQEVNGRKSLAQGLLDVGTVWTIVDKQWTFEDLLDDSIVIDDVRYVTVEFLCNAKTSLLLNGEFSQKDKDDIVLMNTYLDAQGIPKCGCDC